MTDPTSSESQPVTGLARREQRLFFLVDCSASMSLDGKMDTLNVAMASALGEIRKVAEGNPQLNVMLQVLKFSKGAEWTTPEPVPVSSFQWQPMQPDELTRDDPGWAREMRVPLDDLGSHAGKLRFGLEWSDRNDLELSVICPHGNEVSVRNKKVSCCGGWLDVSMNECGDTEQPIEHITFGYTEDGTTREMPGGTYRISVTFNKQHARKSSSDYMVVVFLDGETYKTYEGNISGARTTKIIDTLQIDSNNVVMDSTSGGNTDLGAALTCLGDALKSPPHPPRRVIPPLVVLLSDGEPTDEYEAPLAALDSLPWGKKAQRYAVAIGQDADLEVLQEFTRDPQKVLPAANSQQLATRIVPNNSLQVLQSSLTNGGDGSSGQYPPPPPPPYDAVTSAFDFAKCWQEAWSFSDQENEQRFREYAEGRWEEGDVEW
jgi:uncharacterized protein YegL